MIIAVDCDDVLSETTKAILAHHSHQFNGKHIGFDDITDYSRYTIPWFEASKDYFDRYIQSFLDAYETNTIDPVLGAQAIIQTRKEQGHTLKVVTGRKEHLKDMTQMRIDRHFPGLFDDIIFANHGTDMHGVSKGDLCTHIGASLLLDDGRHNCAETTKVGIPSILFEKPRNKTKPQLSFCTKIPWRDVLTKETVWSIVQW